MFQSASNQPAVGSKTIVVSLETTSVEMRRESSVPGGACAASDGRKSEAADRSSPWRNDGWSYYVFCRELHTLMQRGREKAIRVGGTSFLL